MTALIDQHAAQIAKRLISLYAVPFAAAGTATQQQRVIAEATKDAAEELRKFAAVVTRPPDDNTKF